MDCNSIYANCEPEKKTSYENAITKKICITEIELPLPALLPSTAPASPSSHWGLHLAVCCAVSLHFNLEKFVAHFFPPSKCACAVEMQSLSLTLLLSFTIPLHLYLFFSHSHTFSLYLSLSSYAYQLTARILISFSSSASSAAVTLTQPPAAPPPLASLIDKFVKNKISFLFQTAPTTIKSESICKINKQKNRKAKKQKTIYPPHLPLPSPLLFAYKSVRLYTTITHKYIHDLY